MATIPALANCKDVFVTTFGLKLANAQVWISPDNRESRLQLPLKWIANTDVMWLSLDVKRIDSKSLEATFTHKGAVEVLPFKAIVAAPEDEPRKFAQIIKDPATGDEWALQLLPVCRQI